MHTRLYYCYLLFTKSLSYRVWWLPCKSWKSFKPCQTLTSTFSLILGDFNAQMKSWWCEDITSHRGPQTESLTMSYILQQLIIVGNGDHNPLFFCRSTPLQRSPSPSFCKIPLFLEIQDVPTLHRSIRKTKVLNNFCNQFVYNFLPSKYLNFGKMFVKVARCKPDIML